MKIALAQLNYHIGDFAANTAKIIEAIRQAERSGAELAVFSELCVCGYPPRDFLEFDEFIRQGIQSLQEIAAHTHTTAALVGCPRRNPAAEGKDLFNSVFLLENGEVKHVADKTLLPNYDVFDECRYFEPNSRFQVVQCKGKTLAVTVCEDIWNVGNDNPLYTVCPMDELIKQRPDCIINLSASPFSYVQHRERLKVIRANVERYRLPLIYVNTAGAQTDLIFDGGSLLMNAQGQIEQQLSFFQEELKVVDTDLPPKTKAEPKQEEEIALIHDALVTGIGDYFQKLGFQKAILGLSGGIDSAVVLALAVRALGKDHVLSLLLPSSFSTSHSLTDAEQLCNKLQSPYETLAIEPVFQSFQQTLQPYFHNLPFNVAEENLQARTRGVLLMAFSNKFGYILLNTTNKSEAAVGYGTLYGDMCGGLAVLGDVYKTQVYQLAEYINREQTIIPLSIIQKAPSAELRPNQKDSDSLPDYSVLDKILFHYIEKRTGPTELCTMGFDPNTVRRVLRLVNTNEWKRFQAPPILRVSPKSFGVGRRMPIEGKYLG